MLSYRHNGEKEGNMNGYELGLTMFTIDFFVSINERKVAEEYIDYLFFRLNIDRTSYKLLHEYLIIQFKNKEKR